MKDKNLKHHIIWKFLGITFGIVFLILLIFFIGLIIDTYIPQNNQVYDINPNFVNKNNPVIYDLNNDFYIGNQNANITIIEFFDPECPFCNKYHKKIYTKIYENYIINGKVKYVFKYLPQSIHEDSFNASLAIECSREQSKGIEYKDKILEKKRVDSSDIGEVAKTLNLNITKFNSCLNSQKYIDVIYANIQEAKNLKITQTPTIIINGQIIEGLKPYSYYKKIIDNQ